MLQRPASLLTLAAVVCLSLVALPASAQPQKPAALLTGLTIPAAGVGSKYPVEALVRFVTAAGLTRVVLDFDCIGKTGPQCDARALRSFAAALQTHGVALAAMYRPRFETDPTVRTQVNANHGPAERDGFEICYSNPAARQWGSAWVGTILKALPACDEVIVGVLRDLCHCQECEADGETHPRAGVVAFLRDCREVLRRSRSQARLGMVGSVTASYWTPLLEDLDCVHPALVVSEQFPVAATTRSLAALRPVLGDKLGYVIYQLREHSLYTISAEHLHDFLLATQRQGLAAALWGLDTAFLSDLHDPQQISQGLGLDWAGVSLPLEAMVSEAEADDGEPLLTVPDDRPDLQPVPGSYAVVTTVVRQDPYYAAAAALAGFHGVEVTQLARRPLAGFCSGLRALRAEQIAIVAPPEHIVPDLVQAVFLAAVTMDQDVDLDFTYGFITGDTPEDAVDLVQRTIEAHARPPRPGRAVCVGNVFDGMDHCFKAMETRAAYYRKLGVPAEAVRCDDDDPRTPRVRDQRMAALQDASIVVFCGHGSGANSCGIDGKDFLTSRLDHAVVFDGACFSGAVSEVWMPNVKTKLLRRTELRPQTSIALCMMHAGAIGRFGSACSNGFGLVLEACRGVDAGLSLGEAFRYCQDANTRRARLRQVTIYPYREGELSPQHRGAWAHRQSANIAAVILYGDPSYVPFPGGLEGADKLSDPAATPASAYAGGREGGPEALKLAAGRTEYVMRGHNGLSTMVIQYLPERSFALAPAAAVSDNRGVRALLRFDLSRVSLAAGARLKRATLRLYATRPTGPTDPGQRPLGVCAVTSLWDKTVTWPTMPRFAEAPLAVTMFEKTEKWLEFDLTETVARWLADPASNYGVLLRFLTEGQSPSVTWYFSGALAETPEQRPRLVLDCE